MSDISSMAFSPRSTTGSLRHESYIGLSVYRNDSRTYRVTAAPCLYCLCPSIAAPAAEAKSSRTATSPAKLSAVTEPFGESVASFWIISNDNLLDSGWDMVLRIREKTSAHSVWDLVMHFQFGFDPSRRRKSTPTWWYLDDAARPTRARLKLVPQQHWELGAAVHLTHPTQHTTGLAWRAVEIF